MLPGSKDHTCTAMQAANVEMLIGLIGKLKMPLDF